MSKPDDLDETSEEQSVRRLLALVETAAPIPATLLLDFTHGPEERLKRFVRDLRRHVEGLQEQVDRDREGTAEVLETILRLVATPQRPAKVEALRNTFVAGVRTGNMTVASEIVATIEGWDDRHVLIVRTLFNADRDASIPLMDRDDKSARIGSPDVGGRFLDDLLHEELPSIETRALARAWTVLQNAGVVLAHPEGFHGLTLTKGRSHLKGVLTEWGRTIACHLNDSIDPTYEARGQHASTPRSP